MMTLQQGFCSSITLAVAGGNVMLLAITAFTGQAAGLSNGVKCGQLFRRPRTRGAAHQ